jgi:hypothetical protein
VPPPPPPNILHSGDELHITGAFKSKEFRDQSFTSAYRDVTHLLFFKRLQHFLGFSKNVSRAHFLNFITTAVLLHKHENKLHTLQFLKIALQMADTANCN